VLQDLPDDDLGLPDVSELDGRGGNVSRPRAAQAMPPDHQPRHVENVIRDPRLAAKAKAQQTELQRVTPDKNLRKGDAWGGGSSTPAAPEPRVTTSTRGLVIEDKQRRALEVLLDCTLADAGDLLRAINKISLVQVGGFTVELNQPEREEIARRAAFNNRSPEQEWAACFDFIKPMVFNAMVVMAGARDLNSGKREG